MAVRWTPVSMVMSTVIGRDLHSGRTPRLVTGSRISSIKNCGRPTRITNRRSGPRTPTAKGMLKVFELVWKIAVPETDPNWKTFSEHGIQITIPIDAWMIVLTESTLETNGLPPTPPMISAIATALTQASRIVKPDEAFNRASTKPGKQHRMGTTAATGHSHNINPPTARGTNLDIVTDSASLAKAGWNRVPHKRPEA